MEKIHKDRTGRTENAARACCTLGAAPSPRAHTPSPTSRTPHCTQWITCARTNNALPPERRLPAEAAWHRLLQSTPMQPNERCLASLRETTPTSSPSTHRGIVYSPKSGGDGHHAPDQHLLVLRLATLAAVASPRKPLIPTQSDNRGPKGGSERTPGLPYGWEQIPRRSARCGELCGGRCGWGPPLSTVHLARRRKCDPLTTTTHQRQRFHHIATYVRGSRANRAQLAAEPNFGAVAPTPWVGRAQPGAVSPSASARSVAPRTLGNRSRPPACMSVESIHTCTSLKMDFRRLGRIELRARPAAAGHASGGAR